MAVPPTRNWGGQNAFRRQVHYVIKERLEPSLKAAGSALEQSLKAQVYIRGVNNFPDFIDVWSQYFRDIPCAVTLVPAKDYSSIESMLEINLIALKTGATRRKQVVEVDIPALASYGPCVRAGELVFPSGLMALEPTTAACPPRTTPRRSMRSGSTGQAQGALIHATREAVCKAVGVPMGNVVRAQYFLTDIRDFAGVAAAWSDRYGNQPHPFADGASARAAAVERRRRSSATSGSMRDKASAGVDPSAARSTGYTRECQSDNNILSNNVAV